MRYLIEFIDTVNCTYRKMEVEFATLREAVKFADAECTEFELTRVYEVTR